MPSAIKQARERAGLTAAEVAWSINRDGLWLTNRENGVTPLDPDHERRILAAINRLERFHQTVAAAKEKLCADLRLPPKHVEPSKPRPPQPRAA